MTDLDDWSSAEDAQLRRLIRDGDSWSDIADAFLRTIAEVQTRAVQLDRREQTARAAAHEERVTPAAQERDWVQDDTLTAGQTKARFNALKPQRNHGPAFDATPRALTKTCVRCARAFTTDDLWLDHAEGPEHFDCCTHITEPQPAIAEAAKAVPVDSYIHAKPVKERPKITKGGCNGKHADLACCLRSRHRGDHLTENGIIFSRDGKDVWKDIGDTYLMMALNNDMVAPRPSP